MPRERREHAGEQGFAVEVAHALPLPREDFGELFRVTGRVPVEGPGDLDQLPLVHAPSVAPQWRGPEAARLAAK